MIWSYMVGMVKRMLWMTRARPLQHRRRYGKLGDMAFNRMEKADKKTHSFILLKEDYYRLLFPW